MPSYPANHMRQAAAILAEPVAKVGDGPVTQHWSEVPSVHTGRNPFRRAFSGTLYGPDQDSFVERKPRHAKDGPHFSRIFQVGCTVKTLDYMTRDARGNVSGEGGVKGENIAK